jgi:Protein of unknown function (DUF 659)
MATSPECCLFLESVNTGKQGHNADWIVGDISRVLMAQDSTTFAGVVTDNTSTNRKACKMLRNRFPACYFQGCCSHGLHFFVKDIFAPSKTKKGNEPEATYPIGYPFEDMLEFVAGCKDVVKFFYNHHVVKAQLNEMQKAARVRSLFRPAPIR